MTSEERQEYMKTKMEETKAKLEKKEAVLDKLLNLQALTAEEELIRQEIVKERAERKAKLNEIK
ncbi:MAG: hypothetical protein LBD88_03340 [Candidatus Peribacteria bacterium]|jgi:hypothetical protein|nr:hypothetical protein [Candidatus Peribacteria bacterium]